MVRYPGTLTWINLHLISIQLEASQDFSAGDWSIDWSSGFNESSMLIFVIKKKQQQTSVFVLCRYDYVEIHDGNSESADLMGRHCSNIAPAPITSSGPSLHIKFVSDYAHQGAGFSLRYEIYKTGMMIILLSLFL